MKPVLILTILLLAAKTAIAQQVVASAGHSGTVTGYAVDWTLGETVIETISGTDHTLTQGMHHTKLMVTALFDIVSPGMEAKVYPNPTGRFLRMEAVSAAGKPLHYELTDMAGRRLVSAQIHSARQDLDLQYYVPGIYFLRVFSADQTIGQVFKIIKN